MILHSKINPRRRTSSVTTGGDLVFRSYVGSDVSRCAGLCRTALRQASRQTLMRGLAYAGLSSRPGPRHAVRRPSPVRAHDDVPSRRAATGGHDRDVHAYHAGLSQSLAVGHRTHYVGYGRLRRSTVIRSPFVYKKTREQFGLSSVHRVLTLSASVGQQNVILGCLAELKLPGEFSYRLNRRVRASVGL